MRKKVAKKTRKGGASNFPGGALKKRKKKGGSSKLPGGSLQPGKGGYRSRYKKGRPRRKRKGAGFIEVAGDVVAGLSGAHAAVKKRLAGRKKAAPKKAAKKKAAVSKQSQITAGALKKHKAATSKLKTGLRMALGALGGLGAVYAGHGAYKQHQANLQGTKFLKGLLTGGR